MKRNKIVAGNWKMNTDLNGAYALTKEVEGIVRDEVTSSAEIILCPPFISLAGVVKILDGNDRIAVGAQNCHHQESGAYTGSVSAEMVASTNASHVIIGHSERRQYAHEDNQLLATKIDLALKNNLIPIYCFGETQVERQSGQLENVISKQISEGVFHLSKDSFSQLILAYEPVWAIGTGETASPEQAEEIHAMVRKQIQDKYDIETSQACRILYGGSVKPGNAAELFGQPNIDGGLIGGAALNARDFAEIIKQA
jgi:triosephosphate isomerase